MLSDLSKRFFNMSYLIVSCDLTDVIDELNDMYKESTKSPMYSKEVMYWMGYMYVALGRLYELNPKQVYKLLPANKLRLYYPTYHTFDIEEGAERIMESINYKKSDLYEEGLKVMRRILKSCKEQLK